MDYTIKALEHTIQQADIDRILELYGDSLLRMCYIYLRDKQLAEDAVQDTLIKIYRNYHTFKSYSSEKTWIMAIAINTCKNYMRANWFKKVVTGLRTEHSEYDSLDEKMIKDEKGQEIIEEIMQLNHKYREVILLYYYQEMSTKEISAILGIKEGTVRVRLQRAREKLSITLRKVGYR
ncbi:MAG: polymerase sigma factor [Clostridia bacterium]|jgi:RNA polymerase sigma-70 factor (ECF subfamily)|nr:polymerase sigma factor [Clostridia bacterium]